MRQGLTLALFVFLALLDSGLGLTRAGPLTVLDQLVDLDKKMLRQKYVQLQSSVGASITAKDSSQILKLDPDWLSSILLHSPPSSLAFLNEDICRFVQLWALGLLKDSNPQNQFAMAVMQTKKGPKSQLFSFDEMQKSLAKKCPSLTSLDQLANPELQKLLFSKLPTLSSGGISGCQKTINKWKSSEEAPLQCAIFQTMKKASHNSDKDKTRMTGVLNRVASTAESFLGPIKKALLGALCQRGSPRRLCRAQQGLSFWASSLTDTSSKVAQSVCAEVSEGQDRFACFQKIQKFPLSCQGLRPQLTPALDCLEMGQGLAASKLKASLLECSREIRQDQVGTLSRLLYHFAPRSSSRKQNDCLNKLLLPIYNFFTATNLKKEWKKTICFESSLEQKEVCLDSTFSLKGDLGLVSQIEKYVNQQFYKRKKDRKNFQCQQIRESSFNPMLLKYQTGCFMVLKDNCNKTPCPFELFLDNEKIARPNITNQLSFRLFPESSERYNQAVFYYLKNKLQLKPNGIKSLSDFIENQKQFPRSIALGIGCREDFLFQRFSSPVQQCTPQSFLLTGLASSNERGVRTSIVLHFGQEHDAIARTFRWATVSQAVERYSQQLSYEFWPLQALSKRDQKGKKKRRKPLEAIQ